MSPLWRDEIGIYLAPHKLALTRLARGVKPKSVGEASWTNELEDDTHWSNALNALDALLAKPDWQGAVARVVVSDHWVRYAMVPFSDALSGAAERLTHARHVLTGIYGEVVSQWTVTLADSRPGQAQVACALPAGLLEELQLMLSRHRIPLQSLQPQLVLRLQPLAHAPARQRRLVRVDRTGLAGRSTPGRARLGSRAQRAHRRRLGHRAAPAADLWTPRQRPGTGRPRVRRRAGGIAHRGGHERRRPGVARRGDDR